MKVVVFVLIFVLLGLPSFQQKPLPFTVKGKFKDIPNTKIYLQLLSHSEAIKDKDSLQTGGDGSYRFKATAKEQQLYLIGPKNGQRAIFTNDSKQVTINLSKSNFKFPEIIGSKAPGIFINSSKLQPEAMNFIK